MKKSLVTITIMSLAAISLAACGSHSGAEPTGAAPGASKTVDPGEKGFDVSGIKPDPAVEALVPANIKSKGILDNGASTDYAPGEYRKADGQTPTGYDVDMIKAIAKVMGLKDGKTTHADFDSLIPQIGKKFDVGASSFTITPERLKQVNMIAYAKVGFSYGVKKGNPKKFDPQNICGKTIGVQTGTAQMEYLEKQSEKCKSEGKPEIQIKPHDLQTEVTTKVVGGQYDATLADSPVIGYAVKLTNGQLEVAGQAFDTAKHGIAVAKDNEELTKAVEAALAKLMSDGTLEKIFATYGAQDILLPKPELNPTD